MAEQKEVEISQKKIIDQITLITNGVKGSIARINLDSSVWPPDCDIEWADGRLALKNGNKIKLDIFQKTYLKTRRTTAHIDGEMETVVGTMSKLMRDGLNKKFETEFPGFTAEVEFDVARKASFVIITVNEEIEQRSPQLLLRQSTDEFFTQELLQRKGQLNYQINVVKKVLSRFFSINLQDGIDYLNRIRIRHGKKSFDRLGAFLTQCMSLQDCSEPDWTQFSTSDTTRIKIGEVPVVSLTNQSETIVFEVVGLLRDLDEEAEYPESCTTYRLICKNVATKSKHVVTLRPVNVDNADDNDNDTPSNTSVTLMASIDDDTKQYQVQLLVAKKSCLNSPNFTDDDTYEFNIEKLSEFLKDAEYYETDKCYKPKPFIKNAKFVKKLHESGWKLTVAADLLKVFAADSISSHISDSAPCIDFSSLIPTLEECGMLRCMMALTPAAITLFGSRSQKNSSLDLEQCATEMRGRIGTNFENFETFINTITNLERECDSIKVKMVKAVRQLRNHVAHDSPVGQDASEIFSAFIGCLNGTDDEITFRILALPPPSPTSATTDTFNLIDPPPLPVTPPIEDRLSDCDYATLMQEINEINIEKTQQARSFQALTETDEAVFISLQTGHDDIEQCPMETKDFVLAKFNQCQRKVTNVIPKEIRELDYSSVSAFFRSITKSKKQLRNERKKREKREKAEHDEKSEDKTLLAQRKKNILERKRSSVEDSKSPPLSPRSLSSREAAKSVDLSHLTPITTELEARLELINFLTRMRKNWNKNKNWSNDRELKDWDSVKVNARGLPTVINFTSLDLTGQCDESIGRFTSLTRINLQGNDITSMPESISLLVNLKTLKLDGNPCIQEQNDRQRLKKIVRDHFSDDFELIMEREFY